MFIFTMRLIQFWVFFVSLPFLHAQQDIKVALITFLQQLSNTNNRIDPSFGWNSTSDPCSGGWKGITCDSTSVSVKKIVLEDLNLTGTFDAKSVCSVQSLIVLSIQRNSIRGEIPVVISNCKRLTHLFMSNNRLSGILPDGLSLLNNLKRIDISFNIFSGRLPDFSRISGLITFLAQYNHLNGELPKFDFSNFKEFNVSYNDFTGPIPVGGDHFNESSFMGNLGLCGAPLLSPCQPSQSNGKSSRGPQEKIIMVSGYIILALVFIIFMIYRLVLRKKAKNIKVGGEKENSDTKISSGASNNGDKTGTNRSEYSIPSSSNSPVMSPSSLVVLSNRMVKTLRFEDLLKAPAELLGRGRHGSLYKVIVENGSTLAVKRIKDWGLSREEFQRRMAKMDQARHPYVLPAIAFYCSKKEKLLVYEYQQNGSLFNLLHGNQGGLTFDWSSRLCVASSVAQGLAFMHKELYEHGIAHGNMKSSNIMFKDDMQPCISEYGLMVVDNQNPTSTLTEGIGSQRVMGSTVSPFKVDVYGFGIMLLELLTGKMVHNTGFDLAKWVNSVVREEWTVEVFDKALIAEGASEVNMVNLLQVAVKCINSSPENRPTMHQVTAMINTVKEEEERSIVSET